jgi:hypothetical protein
MRYRIEQRIETLADNAVMKDSRMEAAFSAGAVRYSHWDFDHSRGWPSDFWLAEASIEANDYKAAFRIFRRELNRVIPRISLINQAYTDFLQQPLLIVKDSERVGFLRYIRKKRGVGLMFVEDHRQALIRLLEDASIPGEFYYYWNDVVNAVGYTPKVLLMCAAIECLTKTGHGKKDWEKVERVLGRDLKEELYGTKEDSSTGLRHRLSHGDYFGADHSGKNYVELIHKRVMAYFNDHILKASLLELNVVGPQRHFVGDLEGGSWFIRSKQSGGLSLKSILVDFEKNDVNQLTDHELVYDDSLTTSY